MDSVVGEQMRRRLAARTAAGDFVHAAREFLATASRLADATRAWDPTGESEDPMITGAAETVGELLTLAALAAPGIRALFVEALAASAPPPDPASPGAAGRD